MTSAPPTYLSRFAKNSTMTLNYVNGQGMVLSQDHGSMNALPSILMRL